MSECHELIENSFYCDYNYNAEIKGYARDIFEDIIRYNVIQTINFYSFTGKYFIIIMWKLWCKNTMLI